MIARLLYWLTPRWAMPQTHRTVVEDLLLQILALAPDGMTPRQLYAELAIGPISYAYVLVCLQRLQDAGLITQEGRRQPYWVTAAGGAELTLGAAS
jgi:DNA-binding transcriptional ArsR family regulator